jgi:hypothetical protein
MEPLFLSKLYGFAVLVLAVCPLERVIYLALVWLQILAFSCPFLIYCSFSVPAGLLALLETEAQLNLIILLSVLKVARNGS